MIDDHVLKATLGVIVRKGMLYAYGWCIYVKEEEVL